MAGRRTGAGRSPGPVAARRGRRLGRRAGSWLAAAVVAFGVAGCSVGSDEGADQRPRAGPSVSSHPVEAVPSAELDASVAQFRHEEGTRDLLAGVTNNSPRTIRVTTGTIRWAGFHFPRVEIGAPDIPTGQTAAFTIRYGRPVCAARPPRAATLVATIDGQERRLPLRVEDPGLLLRLHRSACLREALDAVARVRLVLDAHPRGLAGGEVLPGAVVVQRRPGTRTEVAVEDLGGSVLFDLTTRRGGTRLPVTLAPSRRALSLPVYLRSAGRCDAHSVGQSQQTFLLSVYVRLGKGPTQRVVAVPSTVEQQRLMRMLDRVCGLG